MKVLGLLLLLSYSGLQYAHAQQDKLQIGDIIPDLEFTGVRNYKEGALRLRDFRGKLLIFDFWDVYCPSCIRGMPEMEKLQQQFDEQIQIVLVTKSSEDQVEALFKKSAIARDCTLPSIIGDTVLTRLFLFRTVPTHVWIDEKGEVRQFTGPFTNVQTISDYLAGEKITLPVKKEYMDFDVEASLLKEGAGRQLSNIKYYSALFKKIDDDGGGVISKVDSQMNQYRKTYRNYPLVDLFQHAFEGDGFQPDSYNTRVILEGIDTGVLERPSGEEPEKYIEWTKSQVFSYEACIPLERRGQFYSIMQRDLLSYSDWSAKLQSRKMKCLVIHGGGSVNEQEDINGVPSLHAKVFFSALRQRLTAQFRMPVVIDESRQDGKVRIPFPNPNAGFEETRMHLARYGIELVEETRDLKMLVLKGQ